MGRGRSHSLIYTAVITLLKKFKKMVQETSPLNYCVSLMRHWRNLRVWTEIDDDQVKAMSKKFDEFMECFENVFPDCVKSTIFTANESIRLCEKIKDVQNCIRKNFGRFLDTNESRGTFIWSPKFHKFFDHFDEYIKIWSFLSIENEESIEACYRIIHEIESTCIGLIGTVKWRTVGTRYRNR